MCRIGTVLVSPPFGLAPLAGLTDSAFRRLIKRQGGCGLVVTEMVSAEGLLRNGARTRAYAAFVEEERPVAVQIFGSDPERMAGAARDVERLGADLVDINMGCPVPKVARRGAGCSLLRTPDRAAAIVAAMVAAVRIPVTVKIRLGWTRETLVAPRLARMLEDAGAAAIAVHGRTAEQGYGGAADWDAIAEVASSVRIPVLGNGDCLDPAQVIDRWRQSGVAGVLVGRGLVRNPWLLAQVADRLANRPERTVTPADRARFLYDYLDLLLADDVDGRGGSERPGGRSRRQAAAAGRDRWVVGKVRALLAWYTKGLTGGSALRAAVNRAPDVETIRQQIQRFFGNDPEEPILRRDRAHADLRV